MTETKITDDHIREHAYRLWQDAGSPQGAQDEFWHRATAELEQHPPEQSLKSADDLVEAAGGHYPPTGDSQNFA